jgi:hypothetical protein
MMKRDMIISSFWIELFGSAVWNLPPGPMATPRRRRFEGPRTGSGGI